MTFSGHFKDLRNCLIICAVTFLLCTLVSYYFAPVFITYAMSRAEGYTFIQTGVAELLGQYIKTAMISGLVFSSPVIAWQAERFIGPGLKRGENVKFIAVMIAGLVLFVIGACFANFIVIPFTLQFFLGLNTIGIGGFYSIKEYISYIVALLFSFGLVFEIPVVTSVLTSAGLMKPRWMKAGRRYILVLCVLLAAVITPPDIASQIMVAIPMYVIYEISILISSVIYRSKCKKRDPDDSEKNEKKAESSRWALAKAAAERKEREKDIK